jgi:hypothetical protein
MELYLLHFVESMCVCMYVCMYVCVYLCTYVCVCARLRAWVHVCMYVIEICVYIYIYIYIYIYMCVCVCVCVLMSMPNLRRPVTLYCVKISVVFFSFYSFRVTAQGIPYFVILLSLVGLYLI